MKNPLIAGSRESLLALTQTRLVMQALQSQYPELEIALKTYKTQGDLILDSPLFEAGDKGLFVKELEQALLNGEIDFAVHSMKDMPSEQPKGLHLFPFGEREAPLDAFVSKSGLSFQEIPAGSVIGTSSLRREALLKRIRPDLTYEVVRGNVQTRLRKLDEGPYEAIILAVAGLRRLGLEHRITHTFSLEEMIPACCQGTLGVEIYDPALLELFKPFIHPETQVCTTAERSFMRTLQGGCHVPMAAYASRQDDGQYRINGLLCSLDSKTILSAEQTFSADKAIEAGQMVARDLLHSGGQEILSQIQAAKTGTETPA